MIQGTEPTEQDIDLSPVLRAARAGDPSAWKFLVNRYSRRIFGLVFARCHSVEVAEEITQSVFATITAKLLEGEYTEDGRFEAWIFRIAINRLRDHLRRDRIRPDAPAGDSLEEIARAGVHKHQDSETHARLRMALEELSESDRDVVMLRHHGGLSFKQIADLLDEPMGTLLARHHRALKKLKELMDTEGNSRTSIRSGSPVRGI